MDGRFGSSVKTRREKPDNGGMIYGLNLMRCIALIAVLCSVDASANRVLSVTSNEEQVTVTNEATARPWLLNEPVCLFQGNRELACGFIGGLSENQIIVRIEAREFKILPSNVVTLRREGRNVSAVPGTAAERTETALAARFRPGVDVGFGPVAGFNYVFPFVPSIQFAVDRRLTFGADFRYSTFCAAGVTRAVCVGFMATLNYYYTESVFKGGYFSAGAGAYSVRLENGANVEKISPVAFQGLAGWRGRPGWSIPLDIGVAGGFQYVAASAATFTIRNNFTGILPVFGMSLGCSF